MKRAVSIILSLILLISVFGTGAVSYAASKAFAEEKLVELQKKSGYVPGKTSVITGNCYAFVSKVCEELYGKSYYYEQQVGNYEVKHATGYFYTVATHKTDAINALDKSNAERIRDFFIANALPGDIIHYGSLTQTISSKHTFMVQSIDAEKMRIYHANYAIAGFPSSACHIDTIYWDSFVSAPTQTIYNKNRTIYSLNSLFNNKMRNGGVGITVNRFKDYTKLFYVVKATVPTLTVKRDTTSSLKLEWDKVASASKYQVQYKKSNDDAFITADAACKNNYFVLSNLELGKKYNIRVRAYIGDKWFDYCDAITKKVLPPVVTKVTFTVKETGLKLKWAKRTDIDGVRIYKCATKDGTYKLLKTITDLSTNTYTDTAVKYGVPNYYKLERYKASGSKEYTAESEPFEGTYALAKPELSIQRISATAVDLTVVPDGAQSEFVFSIKSADGKNYIKKSTTKDTYIPLNGLEIGMEYTILFAEKNKFGTGESSELVFTAIPKEITDITAAVKTDGIKIKWNKETDVTGYQVYRSEQQDTGYVLAFTAENKETGTFIDSGIKYGTDYYYIVRGTAEDKDGNTVIGAALAPVGPIKYELDKPTLKVALKSPTSVTVSWTKVSRAKTYDLQYKEKGGSWKSIKKLTGKTKTVGSLKTGTKYYFRVRAVNAIGKGSYTAKVAKTVKVPTPAAPVLSKVKKGVKVAYKPASYASGYKIYRAASKNGKYKLIGTVTGKKKKSFTDTTVKKYRTYYYQIRCYVTKNDETYQSSRSDSANIAY